MLGQILIEKKMILDIKEDCHFPFRYLIPEQKARSISLLETILRNLSVLDKIINSYLTHKTSVRVHNILRIAAAEILIDKIAIHAAVDSAVRLTKLDKKLTRFSGLVNAVCRKISAKLTDGSSLGDPILGNQLVSLLKKHYDFDTIKNFSLAQKKRPPLDITLKDATRQNYYAKLLDGNVLPSGTVRLKHQKQVSKLPGYEEGDWWVQDFSASLPIKLLGAIDGFSALDVCAAPGSKTLQLISGGASVTAIEISEKRAKILKENMNRTSLVAELIIGDLQQYKTNKLFDIVLVDAPCSATGTLRRNCELQYLDPVSRINGLVKQQKAILKKSMSFVKLGGILVYCTCSLVPAEGEDIISHVLDGESSWKQVLIKSENLGINEAWLDVYGGLRLRPDYWPSIGGMDGFYIAILTREN